MLIACGMPADNLDFIHCGGRTMGELIATAPFRTTQFTGSCEVAEGLARETHGKVRLEDAGFDWKIFGPDVPTTTHDVEYIAWVADQDAYACSGQKCSAQSICFIHENWMRRHPSGRKHMDSMGGSRGGDIPSENLVDRMAALASHRKLSDLSIGPVSQLTNNQLCTDAVFSY